VQKDFILNENNEQLSIHELSTVLQVDKPLIQVSITISIFLYLGNSIYCHTNKIIAYLIFGKLKLFLFLNGLRHIKGTDNFVRI
jgi:hypothetical protein